MQRKGWYYEVRFMGKWRPRWSLDRPMVKDGKIHTYGGGPGPKIRGLVPIEHDRRAMTLGMLQNWYGPDGDFQNVTRHIPREA
jgi:hypothetical protein